MMVTPADHVIEPVQEFRRAMQAAIALVEEHPSALVTFGIPTTYPATGYGYIHRGAEVPGRLGVSAYRAQAFREKPPFEEAQKYHTSGEYFWNSGIFVWKARTVLDQLAQRSPQTHAGVTRIAEAWDTPAREAVLHEVFPTCEQISIDFAVMQKAPEVLVVQAPYQWDDVGSWLALDRMHPHDADGNTVLGRHAGIDTHRCVLVADGDHLIATVGVDDLIIIHDGDVTLVAPRSREGDIRKLVEKLDKEGRREYL
jgi:mannose-1-phosphate guanylyltransferase